MPSTSTSTVLSTHYRIIEDIAEAVSMSDRVIVLSQRPGEVKSEHQIALTTCECKTPIICREAPEFRIYFNKIWKELDVHV